MMRKTDGLRGAPNTLPGLGLLLLSMCLAGPACGDDESAPASLSRGGQQTLDGMVVFSNFRWNFDDDQFADQRRELTERNQAWLEEHIPPLRHDRGDRWPLVIFGGSWSRNRDRRIFPEENEGYWQAWIDRGIGPMFADVGSVDNARARLPALRYFQARGVPIILNTMGWVQKAFVQPPGGTGGDHLPPARSALEAAPPWPRVDYHCPAWLYENPALALHADNTVAVCRLLQQGGIEPASIWIDFESGTFLRNGREAEVSVAASLEQARLCPRCQKRFGADGLRDVASYSAVAEAARGHAQRVGLTDPVHSVFPETSTGAFYVYPVRRTEVPDGEYPAYGWEGSGFEVAQPRVYYTPGFRSPPDRRDPHQVGWNIFALSLQHFSRAARVLRPGETLVPWIGYNWSAPGSLKQRRQFNAVAGSAAAFKEMIYHLMLRRAETFVIYAPYYLSEPLPEDFRDMPRAELGGVGLPLVDAQEAYDDMLGFHDLLRAGEPMMLDFAGELNDFGEHAAVWSGVATDAQALVRTVSFGGETTRNIEAFGKSFTLPFRRQGDFYRLWPDGTHSVVAAAPRPD